MCARQPEPSDPWKSISNLTYIGYIMSFRSLVESKKYWWKASNERASSERISRHSIGRLIEHDGADNKELVSL